MNIGTIRDALAGPAPAEPFWRTHAARRSQNHREAPGLVEMVVALGIGRRASMAFELTDVLRCVTEAGIRHRHPEYDDDMVRMALVGLWLGQEFFRRVHPAVEIDP